MPLLRHCVPSLAHKADTGARVYLYIEHIYPEALIYLWIYGAGFWFAEPLLRHCVPSFALEADTGARVYLYFEHIYTQTY